jgi:tripartite-type tricarboxylate transporter receptor subunit TctC
MEAAGALKEVSMQIRAKCFRAALAAMTIAGIVGGAGAQPYPVKPIRTIIPAAPGSNNDIFFRTVAPSMGATLGQQLIADYRPGGGGLVGAALTVKSPPDGYTIGMVASGFVMHPSMVKNLPYDSTRDFTPLGLIVDVPTALVVHPSLPVANVKDLIALAKARPGQLNYGSSGQGTNTHLAGVLFNLLAKVKLVHVPYKSSAPAIIDLIAGHIELSFTSMPGVITHARGGRLRMLAQTGKVRSSTVTDIPTMQEAGLPGFYVNTGFGFAGPGGIPKPVVERLNSALAKAVREPGNRKSLLDQGADPVGGTPEEHDAFIRTEVARWRKVTREAGITPE